MKTKTDGVVQLGSLDAAGDHEILSQVSFPVLLPAIVPVLLPVLFPISLPGTLGPLVFMKL